MTAAIGHNAGPPFDPEAVGRLSDTASDFITASQKWLDQGEITSEHDAGLLADQISGLRKLRKNVDDARKEAKKPHDDAGRQVQAAFTPILDRLDTTSKALKAMADRYIAKKQAQAEEERRQREAEAAKAAAEAEAAAKKAAEGNNLQAQFEAEEAAQRAKDAQKAANAKIDTSVKSASGAGRTIAARTKKEVVITNINVLFMHYRSRPEVADLLKRLAEADVRAKDVDHTAIPGIDVIESKAVA